jgi:hypothetical protein
MSAAMWKWKLCLTLILVLSELIQDCASDGVMEMLSLFVDLKALAEDAANDTAEDGVAARPVDTAYPLASVEMNALMQLYQDCRSQQTTGLRTWCTGNDKDLFMDKDYRSEKLCPQGILTHPCTGRVLHSNRSANEDSVEYLWPWKGIRCNPYTDPTTVTHMYALLICGSVLCENWTFLTSQV